MENLCTVEQLRAKLRRLADAREQKMSFVVQIAGERITILAEPHFRMEC